MVKNEALAASEERLRPAASDSEPLSVSSRWAGVPAAAAATGWRRWGPAASEIKLAAIQQQIITCDRCTRLRTYCRQVAIEKRRAFRDQTYWARPVPGFGDPNARVLLVGLAPAAHGANRTGRVFTGDGIGGSGDFLMSALNRAGFANLTTSHDVDDGLTLRDAFILAAVRCAPPGNKPTPDEIANCLPHFDAELDALPHISVVVALGKIGFDAYLNLLTHRGTQIRPRPVFGHAVARTLSNGHTLIGCYHPSRQNTHTGKLTPRMMDDVFRRVRRILGNRYGQRFQGFPSRRPARPARPAR